VAGSGLPQFDLLRRTLTSPPLCSPAELWSRAIGALGEETWRRLTDLRVGLVGVGRSGSVAAESLVRLGVRRLALVDADGVELHNLDAMNGVGLSDVGRPKVEALAEHLRSLPAAPEVTAVRASVLDWSALAALKPCDVLICCVDNPAARLATAFLAALYLKPLLDVGTGIFGGEGRGEQGSRGAGGQGSRGAGGAGEQGEDTEGDRHPVTRSPRHLVTPSPRHLVTPSPRRLGLDVRFVLPGDACLLDLGGVGDLARARAELLVSRHQSSIINHPPLTINHQPWWQERAGSLRSLNGIAVHLGLRLLEEFIAGRLRESVWLQGDFDETGLPTLRTVATPRRACLLCAQTAQGDAAVGRWREMLENLSGG